MNNSYNNIDNQPRAAKLAEVRRSMQMNQQVAVSEAIIPTNEGQRTDFAQFAQFATLQNELKRNEDIENSPVFPRTIYANLPDLLLKGCSVFKTERQRDVFLTGALTTLSGCFNRIEGLYDGKMANGNLYCFVIAPPASDKGVLTFAKLLGMGIHKALTDQNVEGIRRYRAEMVQYKATNRQSTTQHLPPVEPAHKMLFIPANSSSAAIMRHIQQNDGGGIIFETEADTLTNTFKQEWGNFDDLLRKAFHQESFSYSRKTESELVEVDRPKPAVALSGTPGQAIKLLISGENGLVSRFMFYYYKTAAIWHDVSPRENINLEAHFIPLSDRVYSMFEALKDKTIVFDLTKEQWKRHEDLFTAKMALADDDLRSTIVRLGTIAYKIAMVLTILRYENQLPEDGKIVCNDTDLDTALKMIEVFEKHADLVYSSILVSKNRVTDNMRDRFLEALSDTGWFSRKEALLIGRALKIGDRHIGNHLKWGSENDVLDHKFGSYRKL